MIAIVDAGPLYVAADIRNQDHPRILETLTAEGFRFVIPALVAAEAMYLVGSRLGPLAEARFVEGLADFDLVAPTPADLARMAELMMRYRSFPLGGADASVVALAERLKTDIIVTLDRRHFQAVRPSHVASFRLLPEPAHP